MSESNLPDSPVDTGLPKIGIIVAGTNPRTLKSIADQDYENYVLVVVKVDEETSLPAALNKGITELPRDVAVVTFLDDNFSYLDNKSLTKLAEKMKTTSREVAVYTDIFIDNGPFIVREYLPPYDRILLHRMQIDAPYFIRSDQIQGPLFNVEQLDKMYYQSLLALSQQMVLTHFAEPLFMKHKYEPVST